MQLFYFLFSVLLISFLVRSISVIMHAWHMVRAFYLHCVRRVSCQYDQCRTPIGQCRYRVNIARHWVKYSTMKCDQEICALLV